MDPDYEALNWVGNIKEPTRVIATEVLDHLDSLNLELPEYGSPYDGPVIWGMGSSSEHLTGRALDFMVMAPGVVGDTIAAYLWANRVRFGLIHMIWKQRIRSTRISPGVWRAMDDRGSPTENHMDHIHVLFSGIAVVGQPYGGDGGTQGDVPVVVPVQEDRYWTPPVDRTVESIQRIVNTKVDGFYGNDTEDAVRDYQYMLGVEPDGYWGPQTDAAYVRYLAEKKLAPKFPLPSGYYFGPRKGPKQSVSGFYSHREDLRRYQTQMKKRGWNITADGLYGTNTAYVTRQFQAEKNLKVDGLIGPATWRAAWEAPIT